MIKLLKHILNDEGQDLKRLALILLILALGAITTMYLAHHLPGGSLTSEFESRLEPRLASSPFHHPTR
jgi:hypothetical protein